MFGSEEKKKRKKQITEALIKLCEEKNYYNITIADICKEAHVNRTIFYHHYSNKDDLLRAIEDEYVTHLREMTPADVFVTFENGRMCFHENMRDCLIEILTYHKKNKALTNFLRSSNGDPYFMRALEKSLQNMFTTNLKYSNKKIGLYEKYCILFFVNGYVNSIWRWLKDQDCSVEEMANCYIISFSVPPDNHSD